MHAGHTAPPRGWLILLAVGLPLSVALGGAIAQLTGGSATAGVVGGITTGLLSFGLGLVVWWSTAYMPWTSLPGWRFIGFHILSASICCVVWWLGAHVMMGLVWGRSPAGAVQRWWKSDVIGWDVMVGLSVYGLAAAMSYAIRLQGKLQSERLEHARADAAMKSAELSALEARLDPHFLFNTLHSVAALIRDRPAEAEDAIDTLGELLRDVLQRRGGELRTLQEEWWFCSRYLELEHLRLGDRLTIECDLSAATLSRLVPPLMLQPVIENAIRHGIERKEGGGTVRIQARLHGDNLWIQVEDDGGGAETVALGEGLGLGVLRARLAARQPAGQLSVRTAPGEGFAVTIAMPLGAG